MSAASATLTALEVSIRSRRAPLTRLKDVRVHSETHATTRLPPIKPCLSEDPIESLQLCLLLDLLRTRHDHRVESTGDLLSVDHACRRAKVFDARVGARANEHPINFYFLNCSPGFQCHVLER